LEIQRKNEMLPSLATVPTNNTPYNPLLHVKTIKGYNETTIPLNTHATDFGTSKDGMRTLILSYFVSLNVFIVIPSETIPFMASIF
jgi:hypothetical protein